MSMMGMYGCEWVRGDTIWDGGTDKRQNESQEGIFSRGTPRLYRQNRKKAWYVVEGQGWVHETRPGTQDMLKDL